MTGEEVSQPQTQYRVIGGGGEVQQQQQQPQQQQQIRVVKMDGGSAAIAQTQQAQPQQIRVLNSDGTTSALGGNFRIISASGQQGGASQIRLVSAGSSSPTRALTL